MQDLYTPQAVARELGVTDRIVSKWVRERPWGGEYGVPTPAARIVSDGARPRYLWDSEGMQAWRLWYQARIETDRQWRANRYDGSRGGARDRMMA